MAPTSGSTPGADDFLARLDAAIGCQQCGGPLGDSPSGDFCCQDHQEAWHAARATPLFDYRDPWDDDGPDRLPGVGTEAMDTGQPDGGGFIPEEWFVAATGQASPLVAGTPWSADNADVMGDLRRYRDQLHGWVAVRGSIRYAAPSDYELDRREALLAAHERTCQRCGWSTTDWWHVGRPTRAFVRDDLCEPCRPYAARAAANVANTGQCSPTPTRLECAADRIGGAVIDAATTAADAVDLVLSALRIRPAAGGGQLTGHGWHDVSVPALLSPGTAVLGFDGAEPTETVVGRVIAREGQHATMVFVDDVPQTRGPITPVDEDGNPTGWAGWEPLGAVDVMDEPFTWSQDAEQALFSCTAPGCVRPAALGVRHCPAHTAPMWTPEFRLPRQTGNLTGDWMALGAAFMAIRTAEQRAACGLRHEQLTGRRQRADRHAEWRAATMRMLADVRAGNLIHNPQVAVRISGITAP